MSKRKEYKESDYKRGYKGEALVDSFLKKKKFKYKWLAKIKDHQTLPFDFVIYNKNKIIAAIECEWKHPDNKQYFKDGVDYIANKVNNCSEKRVPIYYFMICDNKIYKAHMKTIKEKGYLFTKNTYCTKNEEFYRMQLEDLSILEI